MPSVDNRVVQMRFDNKDFEEDIGTSIRSLDRLKSSLKLKDATEGFDEIGRAADRVSQKLTAFGTIGDQILRNIGNEIYSLKNKFVDLAKSMSTDQMRAGWDKYAEKTSAVKTIMSATADQFENEAEQMAYVNEQLDKLNWFTDETSYRLTDMTNNIGKFTNQGQKLDVAVRAMQGIATWAGLSGANVNEASRAMYNLSQAMGIGAVTLIDWKSISNANMATKEFKQTAIDTAVDLGTLKKQADGTYKSIQGTTVTIQNFDQTLSDRWFSSDVLTATLEKFGGFAEVLSDKIQELWENNSLVTTSEYLKYITSYNEGTLDLEKAARKTKQTVEELEADLKRLGSSEYDLGRRAFIASQQAKTFQEAIDATKDAVSSKWLRTFELVFGEYDKARELWTNVANELWNVFAQGLERRNDELEKWVTRGGYQILWRAISDLWTTLKQIGSRSWDIWHALFPELTVNKLMQATYKISTFAYNFKKQLLSLVFTSEELEEKGLSAQDWVKDLTKIMDGFRSAISLVLHVLTELGKWIGIPALNALFDAFKWGLSVISPFSEKFSEFVNKVKSSKIINKTFANISTWFSNLKENLKKQENFKKFLENWQKFKDWLSDIKTSALEKISTFIENLGNMELQMPQIESVGDFLNKIFGYINKLIDISRNLPEAWNAIRNFFSNLDFSSIQNLGTSAANLVSSFFQNLFSDEELKGLGGRWIKSLWEGMKTETGEIDGQQLFENILKALGVGIGTKLGFSLASFFDSISEIPSTAVSTMTRLKDVLTSFAKALRAAAFLQISVGVIAIAIAMKILSKVPYEDLTNVAVSMSLVLGVIALIVGGISGIVGAKSVAGSGNKFRVGKITGIKRLSVRFATVGPALIGFAVALGVVVYAILKLKDVTESVRSSLGTVALITGGILLVIGVLALIANLSKDYIQVGDEIKKTNFGWRLLGIAAALLIMSLAFKQILDAVTNMAKAVSEENVSSKSYTTVVTALIGITAIVFALSILLGAAMSNQGQFKNIFIIAALFGGLYLLMKPLYQFIEAVSKLKIKWYELIGIVTGLSMFLIAFAAAIRIIAETKTDSNNSGIMTMLGLAVVIMAIVGAIYLLKDIDWSSIKDGIGHLALFLAAMTVVGFIAGSSDKVGKGLTIVAAAILAFGTTIALAGAGILSFVKALDLWQKTSSKLKGSGKLLADEVSGFIQGLNGVTDQILLFIGKIMAVIMGAIIAHKAKITDLGSNLLLSFAEGLTKKKTILVATIMLLLLGILDGLSTQDNLDALAERFISLLVGIVSAVSTAILNQAGAIWSALKTLIDTIAWLAAYIVVEVYNSILDLLPADNPLVKFLKQDAQEVEEALDEYRQVILLQAKETTALRKVNDARIKYGEDSSEYKEALKTYEETMNEINDQREEIEDKIEERAEKRPTFIETMAQSFGNAIKWLSGYGFIENELNYIDYRWSALKDHGLFSKEYWSTVYGNGRWIRFLGPVGLLLDGANQFRKDQVDIWKSFEKKTMSQLTDDEKAMIEAFYSVASEYYKSLTGLEADLESEDYTSFLLSHFDEIISHMSEYGYNVGKGFVVGMRQTLEEAYGGGEDLVDSAGEGVQDRAKMKSPSKVFAEFGRFLDLGLVQGIKNNSSLAYDAAGDLANDTIDAFSTVVSNISDAINGDFDFDPTIRPVLDLSEIQNGGTRISSIIGANRFAFTPDMGFSLDRARSVTAATADLNVGQSNLSESMMLMQADIAAMKADNATIVGVLDRYMPSIPEIAHMQMVTDRGALVGELAPIMDKELGSIASRGRRGRI